METVAKVDKLLNNNNRYINILATIAVVIGSAVAIAGGYDLYRSKIWKPKIKVISVDFDNAVAKITANGKDKIVYGNSILSVGGDWGVQFGTTGGEVDYNTLELVKNYMVYDVLQIDDK